MFTVTVTLFTACLCVAFASVPTLQSENFWGNENFDLEGVRNLSSSVLASITRSEVIQRAKEWTAKKIPYCQCNGPKECCGSCPYCSKYRCDCSGYVSYTWGLPYGYTTSTLPEVSHKITKNELQEGDILLNRAEHVVLFGGWVNASKTHYFGYQEPGCHTSGPHYAFQSQIPYPFNSNPSLFLPYRYNQIK